jgi:hypothetical protein
MKRYLMISMLLAATFAHAQHLNLGFTFQYHILKQVKVDAKTIIPASSYAHYNVIDNGWKFFTAGQSLVVGTVAQLDFKKFYVAIEPSFELNTYEYFVTYDLSAEESERIRFHTLFLQVEAPVYVGYQFKTSNIFRFSVFGGAGPVMPYSIQVSLKDSDHLDRYGLYDMRDVLYNDKPYWNSVTGIAMHFANLGRLDVRWVHRLNSPGEYKTTFNSIGAGLTFFLPLNLLKDRVYYEE